jgi:hypothetical protein
MDVPKPANGKARIKPGRRSSLAQLVEMQRATNEAAAVLGADAVDRALNPEQRARAATALANLVKAWNSAEGSKRVIRGFGNPKTVEARNAKPKGPHKTAQPEFAPESEPPDWPAEPAEKAPGKC